MKFRSGYKYQLAEDYTHVLLSQFQQDASVDAEYFRLANGVLTIRKGYAWDGPSGPTIDTRDFMRGSLMHDCLYQLIHEGYLDKNVCRPLADLELYDICRQDGMNVMRANWVYYGLRIGGNAAARPAAEHPILEAP